MVGNVAIVEESFMTNRACSFRRVESLCLCKVVQFCHTEARPEKTRLQQLVDDAPLPEKISLASQIEALEEVFRQAAGILQGRRVFRISCFKSL